MTISFELLEVLVCPLTHDKLHYDAINSELISYSAGVAFPIRDGIPVLILEESRSIKDV